MNNHSPIGCCYQKEAAKARGCAREAEPPGLSKSGHMKKLAARSRFSSDTLPLLVAGVGGYVYLKYIYIYIYMYVCM